jgi:hypothetical protein
MPQVNDPSRCLTALDQEAALIAVIAMSRSSWLVTGILPGVASKRKMTHPNSTAVSREHRRAKTDRLDTVLLIEDPNSGAGSLSSGRA